MCEEPFRHKLFTLFFPNFHKYHCSFVKVQLKLSSVTALVEAEMKTIEQRNLPREAIAFCLAGKKEKGGMGRCKVNFLL